MRSQSIFESLDVIRVFGLGITGGLVAGIIFGIAQTIAAVVQGLPASTPIQGLAAIMLGPEMLTESQLDLPTALIAIATHLLLSTTYGIILAVLSMSIFAVGTSMRGAVLAGMSFGFVIWLINFFLIAAMAFPWFAQYSQVAQLILHVLFFGAPLGYFMGRTLAHKPRTGD